MDYSEKTLVKCVFLCCGAVNTCVIVSLGCDIVGIKLLSDADVLFLPSSPYRQDEEEEA